MNRTIITAIGRGYPGRGGQIYEQTEYRIGSHVYPASPFFVNALRLHHLPQTIVILGTRTSSWDALLSETTGEEPTFREELAAVCAHQETGVSDGQLMQLAALLSAAWQCQVRLEATGFREINDSSAGRVLAHLITIISRHVDDQLIVDTTHSFRSLQMLVFSALQILDTLHPGLFARTMLVYGDLLPRPPSPARPDPVLTPVKQGVGVNLTSVQSFAHVAQALTLLQRAAQPGMLIEILEQDGCFDVAAALRDSGQMAARLPAALAADETRLQRLAYGMLLSAHLQQLLHAQSSS